MTEKPPSERHKLTQRIADFIVQHGFTVPFGGDVYRVRNNYAVDLAIPRLLDGTVQVYGPGFIQVKLSGPLGGRAGDRVFVSEGDVMNFLRLFLVEHKIEQALAIPTKPKQREGSR